MAFGRVLLAVSAFVGVQAAEDCGPDATEQLNPECHKNMLWAREEGLDTDPKWYTAFPFLNKTSPLPEFQYAVTLLRGAADNCSMPCSLSPEQLQKFSDQVIATAARGEAVEEEVTAEAAKYASAPGGNETENSATTTSAPSKAWSVWTYVLIVAGLCCILPCLGLACSAFICYESVAWIFGGDDKPQKKRKSRAVKVADPTTQAAPATLAPPPQATSSSFIAVAQPIMAPTGPMTYAPLVHHAVPMVTVAAAAPPPAYVQALPPMAPLVQYVQAPPHMAYYPQA